jgi:hypothetical protein
MGLSGDMLPAFAGGYMLPALAGGYGMYKRYSVLTHHAVMLGKRASYATSTGSENAHGK